MKCPFGLEYFTKFPQYCIIEFDNFISCRDNVVVPTLQQAYITFTIHFIDSNWELRSFCLDTIPLYDDHTGQNIADATTNILDNWKLTKENLVAMTTDSGANIVVAFS